MNTPNFPPPLQKGDKVIILSPASKIDRELIKGMKARLQSWGLNPVVSNHAKGGYGHYSGTVVQRAEDLQQAFDDPEVRAIFCSRGGYGAIHLVDKLHLTGFAKAPKWVVGYSDITVLHALIQSHGFASLHAPMAAHLTYEPKDDPCTLFIKDILFGKKPVYTYKSHKLNRTGSAKGVLRGGNLSVFYGLRGTPYDFPPDNTILFLEDINERPHVVERIFYNFKLAGILERLSGIIIGQFTEYTEDKSLGKELYAALADILEPYHIPMCFDFPVGHLPHNLPVICGAEVELTIDKKGVKLKF